MRRHHDRAPLAPLSCVAVLHFDRALSEPNTWRMAETLGSIETRIRVAGAREVTVEIALRFRAGKAPGLTFCARIDEDTFCCEGADHHPDLPRLEIVLRQTPPEAAEILRVL